MVSGFLVLEYLWQPAKLSLVIYNAIYDRMSLVAPYFANCKMTHSWDMIRYYLFTTMYDSLSKEYKKKWNMMLEEKSHITTIWTAYYCIMSPLLVVALQLLSPIYILSILYI